MREESGVGAGAILLSFLLGGITGAAVAFLLAPKAGSETRRQIREFADDVKEKAEGYFEQAKETASSTVEKGRGFVEKNRSLLTSAIDGGIEKGKDFIEKKKTLLTSAVEAGVEAYQKEKAKVSESD
ncbi:MAG TPA: YtxH domain-containing protein [Syntrophorhabdales bacterium]|nr:YtxH domain-containing protein [Syntrophorhabdales bacterium]